MKAMRVFESASLGGVRVQNRILRSATFEGACDPMGWPTDAYEALYADLARQGLGALITGFSYVSLDGKAMHPGQGGLETDQKIPAFARVTDAVHRQGGRIFLQLAHAGRQTTSAACGGTVWGASNRRSWYFGGRPRTLSTSEASQIAEAFGSAAARARKAGFDGIQIHAAHGYLIHQFLHPAINRRRDAYALDPATGVGTAFLGAVLEAVRSQGGEDYPVLVKVSAGDELRPAFSTCHFLALLNFLERQAVGAVEVSYGTMDHPFNIFRGEAFPTASILAHNGRFATANPLLRRLYGGVVFPVLRRRLHPWQAMYNLRMARLAREHCAIPIIAVGGFRSAGHIRQAIEVEDIDFVAVCRPLLCEPDFALRIRQDPSYISPCQNCNRCAVGCDAGRPTRCWQSPVPRRMESIYEHSRTSPVPHSR